MSTTNVPTVQVVEIFPTTCRMQSDWCGGIAIILQHEGFEPFTIAQVNYDHRYTSNSHRLELARWIVRLLGFDPDKVECK